MMRTHDPPDPKKKKDPHGEPELYPFARLFGPEDAKADDFKMQKDREGSRYKAQKGNAGDRRGA